MKEKLSLKYLLIGSLFLNVTFLFGQLNTDEREYYKWFDSTVGIANTGILDGTQYSEKYLTINGNHKYFLTSDYLSGDILYDGLPYFDINMKYDIYNDELIVKLGNESEFTVIQLIKGKLDKFTLKNHKFVKLNTGENEEYNSGIYEFLFEGEHLVLFKKHRKFRSEHLDKKFAYSEFDYKSEYLIRVDDKYYSLKSKRALFRLFPQQRKEINSFHGLNRKLKESNADNLVIQLVRKIDNNLIY